MQCHTCGKAVVPGQRFCTGCGASLQGITDVTHIVTVVDDDEPSAVETDGDTSDGDIAVTQATPATEDDANDDANDYDDGDTSDGDTTDDLAATQATPILDGDDHDDDEDVDGGSPADTSDDDTIDSDTTDDLAATQATPVTDGHDVDVDDDVWSDHDPVWAATGALPVQTPISTTELPSTEPITQVVPESAPPEAPVEPTTRVQPVEPATAEQPAASPATVQMPIPAPHAAPPPRERRFIVTSVTIVGFLAAILALVAMFANVLEISTNATAAPSGAVDVDFRTGIWLIDDLADNLSIAGLIAAATMAAGAVGAGFRWRWGAGLAGGAGLAFAGLAAVAVGLAQVPIDAAHEFASIPSEQQFTISITRDVGYWLLIVSGAIGVVVFFASLNHALGDRRPGLNPWIAAMGALAAVIASAGPLLPERLASFSDNWLTEDVSGATPAFLLTGRLVQLGLLALTGVFGFLMVRRYGLGLAIGGMLPALWMAGAVLFEVGDDPVGPGFRNPGAVDMHVHAVTIIGLSALAMMAIVAVVAAFDQSIHDRHP